MGLAIVQTLLFAIGIYKWIVIAMVIFSWLYAFNVVNNSNRFVAMMGDFLYKATEPLLQADPAASCPISAASTFRRSSCSCCIFFVERIVINVLAYPAMHLTPGGNSRLRTVSG